MRAIFATTSCRRTESQGPRGEIHRHPLWSEGGARGKDKGWRALGELPGGEDTGVGF